MKAVFCISKIVDNLYMNWLHVMNSFGPCFILLWSDGFPDPTVSTFSFEMCLALVSIALLTSSLSYSEPFHVVKDGVYAVSVRNNELSLGSVTFPKILSKSPMF